MAYAMLAWTHAFDAMNGWSPDREKSLLQARGLAAKALSLEERLPLAYFVAGLSYRETGEYVKALVEAEKAIRYDPNYANAHVLLATLLYYAGRPEEGLERIKKAMLLNPHHPYNYTFHLGQAYYILRRYDEAIETFQQGLASNPASERLHVWLAAAYAQAGISDEAEWQADQILTLNPEFSIERMGRHSPSRTRRIWSILKRALSRPACRTEFRVTGGCRQCPREVSALILDRVLGSVHSMAPTTKSMTSPRRLIRKAVGTPKTGHRL